jgi:hypothetical protein
MNIDTTAAHIPHEVALATLSPGDGFFLDGIICLVTNNPTPGANQVWSMTTLAVVQVDSTAVVLPLTLALVVTDVAPK